MSKSYDLSTSTKWANLADGDHVVKLRARGAGYGSSSFSNSVTVTKGSAMPTKGDLILIDSKEYRVLKTSGSVAEVLCMYDASGSQEFDTNSSFNNTYAGKHIDTYCNNNFYYGLSSAMKSAIVDKTFTQDEWQWFSSDPTPSHYTGKYSSNTYYLTLTNAAFGTSITRHCYVLSVQDILDYLDATTSMGISDTTLTDTNLWKMLWNQTTSPGYKYLWLRSVVSGNSSAVFYVNGYHALLSAFYVNNSGEVRPAFQIDLSKVEWTASGGVTETDITSTVSAFNINLKSNENTSQTMQSTLGGGNGTYAATCDVADASVTGNILSVYSAATSNKSGNVTVTSGSKSLQIPVNISYETCLTGDTLITMFDGTTKRIDQIELGDQVLSLDKEGKQVPGYVYYCDSHCNHTGKHYDRFVFEDGTELKIVHRHRFYNVNEKKFVHLDLWYEGDEAYKLDGTTTALKETHLRDYEGDIPHYTLFCEHNTYFANGILCGNRFSDPVNFNRGMRTFSFERKQYYPIILTLPEAFSGYKDVWLDSNTKDLMLKKADGTIINYYQVGYDDSYATAYKKPTADSEADLDTIESSYEKVADISHEAGANCVEGKEFDIIVIYVKRTSRESDIAVQAASDLGVRVLRTTPTPHPTGH